MNFRGSRLGGGTHRDTSCDVLLVALQSWFRDQKGGACCSQDDDLVLTSTQRPVTSPGSLYVIAFNPVPGNSKRFPLIHELQISGFSKNWNPVGLTSILWSILRYSQYLDQCFESRGVAGGGHEKNPFIV
jgi:hypothetical protein